MRQVYISFLGANRYSDCIYFLDKSSAPLTRFVQEATLRFFCSEWQEKDQVLIFTTQLAYEKNWLDDGHKDNHSGLGSRIETLGLKAGVKQVSIPDGHSEKEIWEIFEIMFNRLSEGDEVVFDITHAFRSIPMLAIVVLHYAKVLKRINLQGIYYGAFESLGPSEKTKSMAPEKRKAPVLDLTAFDHLLDWSLAVDRFLGAGDAKAISALAKGAVAPFIEKSRGKDEAASAIKYFADALDTFTRNLSSCRGPDISASVEHLRAELNKSRNIELLKPIVPLFEIIHREIAGFNSDPIHDGLKAARWCLDHNLIQQGYTILVETVITYWVLSAGDDPKDENSRLIASQAATIFLKKKTESEWTPPAKEHPEDARRYVEVISQNKSIAIICDTLREYRNDLNHAGYKKERYAALLFSKKLEEFIKKIEEALPFK